jgi:hypothetical protein
VKHVATAAHVLDAVVEEVAGNVAVELNAVQALGGTCIADDCHEREGMQPVLDWHAAQVDKRGSRVAIERECFEAMGACSSVAVDH